MSKVKILKADNIPTGRYARMAHTYLKEHYPDETQKMAEDGSITQYLTKIQVETADQVQTRIQDLRSRQSQNNFQENWNSYEDARRAAEEEIVQIMILTIVPNLVPDPVR